MTEEPAPPTPPSPPPPARSGGGGGGGGGNDPDGPYANRRRIWVTLAWTFAGSVVAQFAVLAYLSALGHGVEEMQDGLAALSPFSLAAVIGLNQALSYLIPGAVAAYTLYGSAWLREVRAAPGPLWWQIPLGLVVLAACLPLTAALAAVNAGVELAEWQSGVESNVAEVLARLISAEGAGGLAVALFVVGVLPALGEELVFRGLLQPAFVRATGSVHVGVWVTALAFGLVHFQFAGLLPRVFLGAVLGFLVAYSGRLWVAVAAHFLFNGAQVVALRLGYIEADASAAAAQRVATWQLAAAFVVAGAALYVLLPRLRPAPPRRAPTEP